MEELEKVLEKYWGYAEFRASQKEIISTVLSGKDCFAMLPTGGGKSICYQIPALVNEGICLVVSPLIALMQDQVSNLENRGIAAAFLHSGMNQNQLVETLDKAYYSEIKILYISPERIQTDLFRQFAPDLNINLIAVDEAHCISQWGHDFRPAYRKIKDIKEFFPKIPIIALTATATTTVQEDIINQLKLKNPVIFKQTVARENLTYAVSFSENKKIDILHFTEQHPGTGIVYCRSRKRTVEMAQFLKLENVDAVFYHAGMQREQRKNAQQKWMESSSTVMAATTAFGMGIDKPNVRLVSHIDVPESLEDYYQEAGRAGRDGQKAEAVLLYNLGDVMKLQKSVEINFPPMKFIKKIYQNLMDYLGIAVESGQEEFYPFDLQEFTKKFKLDLLPTISAIKILEKEGYWQWNDSVQTQTLVEFTTSEETLKYVQKKEPQLSEVCTALLRMYGSVYHFQTAINESEIAKLLKIYPFELQKRLAKLQILGVIRYEPAISGSAIYLEINRMNSRYLQINEKRIKRLKDAYVNRINWMIAYLNEDKICRNIFLAKYFGEVLKTNCGKCDICIHTTSLKNEDKIIIKKEIKTILQEQKEISFLQLSSQYKNINEEELIDMLRDMSDEGYCNFSSLGKIKIK